MSAFINNSKSGIMAIHVLMIAICLLFLPLPGTTSSVSADGIGSYDLINLINGMRSGNGLGALSVDPSLMACAQATAETMAASHLTWHIGNVSGRASSFGYNNYNTCFATENFMMGTSSTTIGQIQSAWSDATHMIPAVNPSYCHIGAGVATGGDGFTYFVVQAAYPAGVAGCGFIKSTGSAAASGSAGASMIIKAVVTATPDDSGLVFHTVEEGQTLWTISEAYKVTIQDIQSWNNLYNSTALSLGQKLYIPAQSEAGKTPTPQVALTVLPTADAQGKFYHIVADGDTLWSISELWNVPLNVVYQANGMTADDSIGIGWKIAIPVTATATPLPTETPTLTPPPSETPVILTTEPENDNAITTETVSMQDSSFMHFPGNSGKVFVLIGLMAAIPVGTGLIIAGNLRRKK